MFKTFFYREKYQFPYISLIVIPVKSDPETLLLCFSNSDEENFCATVPKDGRSYSPTLFSQTIRVLKKINKPGDMIVAFGLLADKIKVLFYLERLPE